MDTGLAAMLPTNFTHCAAIHATRMTIFNSLSISFKISSLYNDGSMPCAFIN